MYKQYTFQQVSVEIFKKFKSTDYQNLKSMNNHKLNLAMNNMFLCQLLTKVIYSFSYILPARKPRFFSL